MSKLSQPGREVWTGFRLPPELHKAIRVQAAKEGISGKQFFLEAVRLRLLKPAKERAA